MQTPKVLTSHPFTHPGSARPWVLFDGACPLCAREIAHYRRVTGSDNIVWTDLSATDPNVQIDGISHDAAMAGFHVRDSRGRWHTGAYGFVELWRHLRYYRALSRFIRLSLLTSTLDAAYTRFARWRLARRCSTSSCTIVDTTTGDAGRRDPAKRQTSLSADPLPSSSLGE